MTKTQRSTAFLSCALCGNNQIQVVGERDRDGKPLRNVLCIACGLVWVDPRPSDENIDEFYSSEYRRQYKGAGRPKPKHCYRETLRGINRVGRFLSVYQPGMRVLDVGAGAGFFAYVLKRKGILIDGIEPNEGYANYARTDLGLHNIRTGFLKDIEKDGYYDLITINHVFEHLPDPCLAMKQMHKILCSEGRVLMEVPNIEATYHAPNKIFHVGHLYWYNPETIRALAMRFGFTVDDVQLVPGTKHINLILRKSSQVISEHDINTMLSGNADHVLNILRNHSMLKHFSSPVPYIRFYKKMCQYSKERAYTKNFHGGALIADALCTNWLVKKSHQS